MKRFPIHRLLMALLGLSLFLVSQGCYMVPPESGYHRSWDMDGSDRDYHRHHHDHDRMGWNQSHNGNSFDLAGSQRH
jgi:hypothetical protein